MRLRTLLLPIVATALPIIGYPGARGSGPIAPDLRVVSDMAEIQGSWELVAAAEGEGKVKAPTSIWTFDGNRLAEWLGSATGNRPHIIQREFELKQQQQQQQPSWITTYFNGKVQFAAVYRLRGDSLLICYSTAAGRPQGFAPKPGSNEGLLTFKRVRPMPLLFPSASR